MHPTYEKYRSLVPLNDEAATNDLLQVLVNNQERRNEFYAASAKGGQFYLMRHESHPGKIIEYVPDRTADTSVTTLYEEHPVFESRQRLIEAREEIIQEIEVLLMAVPGTTTVRDDARNKEFHLFELGTAQLLDVLNHFATN